MHWGQVRHVKRESFYNVPSLACTLPIEKSIENSIFRAVLLLNAGEFMACPVAFLAKEEYA